MGYILKIPPAGIEMRCGSWKKKSAVTAHSEKKSVPPRNIKSLYTGLTESRGKSAE